MKVCLSIAGMGKEFAQMAETLGQYGQVDVVGLTDFSLTGYDIFIGKQLSESILETADCLKAAFAYKTGVDNFPLQKMAEKNIPLVNSHADSNVIAEYAFGLSISLVNRITECDKKLRKGIWYDNADPYWESIFDMKVGLLGYGHIGQEINRILRKNDIETFTLNRGGDYADITPVDTLEELCGKVNLLILSLPKTPQTDNIINRDILALLKDKYIVNVGRSNAIHQEDLYKALKQNYLAGAAIDTWDEKPKHKRAKLNPSKYPFVKLSNVVLSPHQATRIEAGHRRYVEDITNKVITFIQTGELIDPVDLQKGY